MTNIIISRHKGTIEWLKNDMMIEDPVIIKSASLRSIDEYVNKHDKVYGNASLEIIEKVLKKGAEFYYVSVPGNKWRKGGKSKSLNRHQMAEDDAKLLRVKKLELK